MKRNWIFALIVSITLWITPALCLAGSATISWRANTEPDLQGYKLYYGLGSRTYGTPVTIGKQTTYTLQGLGEGKTYYFALTAYDTYGNESGYSSEVSKKIPGTATPAPLASVGLGVFRNGTWYFDSNGDSKSESIFSFGLAGDIPLYGDWNGDGKMKIGVFRKGVWYLDADGDGKWDRSRDITAANFGYPTDVPVVGDWTGDGRTKIGVFRKGAWYLDGNGDRLWNSRQDIVVSNYGYSTDIPVVGDWNKDGKTEIGVFRKGAWYLDGNGDRLWNSRQDIVVSSFGLTNDAPVIADWNRDGISDLGVFRAGTFYLDLNGNRAWDSADKGIQYGTSSDLPIAGQR